MVVFQTASYDATLIFFEYPIIWRLMCSKSISHQIPLIPRPSSLPAWPLDQWPVLDPYILGASRSGRAGECAYQGENIDAVWICGSDMYVKCLHWSFHICFHSGKQLRQ